MDCVILVMSYYVCSFVHVHLSRSRRCCEVGGPGAHSHISLACAPATVAVHVHAHTHTHTHTQETALQAELTSARAQFEAVLSECERAKARATEAEQEASRCARARDEAQGAMRRSAEELVAVTLAGKQQVGWWFVGSS